MRVVYEGGIYEMMRLGGISRYFIEIINRLGPTDQPVVMVPAGQELPLTHPRVLLEQVRTQPPLKMLRRFWRKSRGPGLENQTRSLGGDLVHWTYYVGLCRRTIGRRAAEPGAAPNVITVYDFIHESYPELDPGGHHRRWQRQAIEAADHICCISETTHAELCNRYPEAASRASVTLLGNSFRSVRAEAIPPSISGRPYVLFVGRRGGYKNFSAVWEAWKRTTHRANGLALVAVGPPMKPRERRRLAADHPSNDFFHLGTVSDQTLKGLYQNCRAFVFPSMMEGFGLPALEAMESGAPVIASNCDALREVVQSAGHYFDPNDVDTLADLLSAVADDRLADREEKIRLGFQRAGEFSWERTAQQTTAAYQALLANRDVRSRCAA